MKNVVSLELHEREIQYLLVGLQLFCLNLNSIWTLKKEGEQQELDYANVFMLYEYLCTKVNFSSNLNLDRPHKNILEFKK